MHFDEVWSFCFKYTLLCNPVDAELLGKDMHGPYSGDRDLAGARCQGQEPRPRQELQRYQCVGYNPTEKLLLLPRRSERPVRTQQDFFLDIARLGNLGVETGRFYSSRVYI